MRYLIQYVDGTSKRVSEDEGKKALAAWLSGQRFLLRGTGYAPHYVSAIKPMKDWLDEQRKSGKRICKYGTVHGWEDVCDCESHGHELLPPDERSVVSLPERMRERKALPAAPPTEEELRRQAEWKKMRGAFIEKHSISPAIPEAKPPERDCPNCNGSGLWRFEGTLIDCSCVTRR